MEWQPNKAIYAASANKFTWIPANFSGHVD